jgi:hypothetical protein
MRRNQTNSGENDLGPGASNGSAVPDIPSTRGVSGIEHLLDYTQALKTIFDVGSHSANRTYHFRREYSKTSGNAEQNAKQHRDFFGKIEIAMRNEVADSVRKRSGCERFAA